MTTSYYLILSDGSLDRVVNEDEAVFDHALTFTGRGVTEYGESRNENILHLAENFSNSVPPTNPLIGQLWYDNVGNILNVWDGSWVPVSSDINVTSGTYSVVDPAGTVNLPRNDGGTPLSSPANDVIITNAAPATLLATHIADLVDAHDASAISFVPVGSIPGTTAQDAVEDVQGNIDAHEVDATDAHDASAISFVASGSITSADVQLAIQETKDEIATITGNVTTSANNITAHINDAVDAHDASAISFVPGVTGLVSTNVQDAIDEIKSIAGSPGALETTRVYPSSTQQINAAWTQVLFQVVDFGNDTTQWNTGTSIYTAGFDQEVNVKFAAEFWMENNRSGQMEIRVGGIGVRNHQFTNRDNDDGSSDIAIPKTSEVGVKLRLTTGQQVSFYMFITPFHANQDTSGLDIGTHAEFEIVRVL